MTRKGPPSKGGKPAKGGGKASKDPHAARRKKVGGTGYPRPHDPAAEALRAVTEERPPAKTTVARIEKPVREPRRGYVGNAEPRVRDGARSTPHPSMDENAPGRAGRPLRNRPSGRSDDMDPRRPAPSRHAPLAPAGEWSPGPASPKTSRFPQKPDRGHRRGQAGMEPPAPQRETMRVVADDRARKLELAPPKPSRSQRRGHTAAAETRPLPTPDALRIFLGGARAKVGRNEIARAFGLTSEQRPALVALLERLKAEGGVPAPRRREPTAPAPPAKLPEICVVEVFGTDPDGDALARPVDWKAQDRPPIIYMQPEMRGQAALAPGERVLARLKPIGDGKYEGRTFKRIATSDPARVLGVFQQGHVVPTDRRQKGHWQVVAGEAAEGDIVLAEPVAAEGRIFGPKPVRIVEVIGRMGEAKSVSLICIHAHGIPTEFPDEAVQQAEEAVATPLGNREDLRSIPLVTIDGEDARDFDDAVFAEPDGAGWRVMVAIADVAHYVPSGSALDREAKLRGNSVYFPDRVVPMLPEALSNGWCSLRPNEERGCLFVEMRFDAEGNKEGHRFGRGLMRSFARLTYEEAQAAQDAGTEPQTLPTGHMARLYGAFGALLGARLRRGTLDLDIPERRVVLSPEGQVTGVAARPRLDAHKLIEEFMVAANVCAAEELEALSQPCMYRIHDRPSDQKLEGLRQFLAQFDIAMPPGNQLHPRNFAGVLEKVRGTPHERLVNEVVLRSQSQAAYSPDNIGHFGLALPRYGHFTSPIRRYADLLVHRALVRGRTLGTDGITEAEATAMPEIADQITATERRAAMAERDAVDRYMAAFMSSRLGDTFDARISGVTKFGLFVTVDETGASGLLPFSALPDDRWEEDPGTQSLLGRHTRLRFTLGDAVEVALREANPLTGSLQFQLRQGTPHAKRAPGPSLRGKSGTLPRGRRRT